ncbi:MAG: hypothetical protein KDD03_11175 [Gelidibacter sp.]|nr:hypothetical protein [Gelidibacter sp.]
MTDQQIKENVEGLLSMAHEGKILEAIDKYYHDDLVTREGVNGEPLVGGKKAYLEGYKTFLDNMTRVTTFKGTAGETGLGVSTIQWELDFDNALPSWGTVNMKEIALQEWKDGKIYRETYFYNPE